jgi:H+/Cl- antiporter ClcA
VQDAQRDMLKNTKFKETIEIIALLTAFSLSGILLLLGRFEVFQNIPSWLSNFNVIYTIIGVIAVLCAIFFLWIDEFFKKPWKERNYKPLIVIFIVTYLIYIMNNQ